jgi:hypothetical protein
MFSVRSPKDRVHRAANRQIINSKYGVYSCEFVVNLKKQSQFQEGRMSVSAYEKGDYAELYAFETAKKQSQFKANLS